MGASSSKTTQEWKVPSPTGISNDLIESLQNSKETDQSRAALLEAHIASRVAAALSALSANESARLTAAREKLSAPGTDIPDESLSSHTVSKEIVALREKLAARRELRELPKEVEEARGEVVKCLRENDRRPLDCWKEVQAFKDGVKALEKSWVDKVTA